MWCGCGSRSHIRRRSHPCLIGKQATLDAVEHCCRDGTGDTAGRLFEAKGALHDSRQHPRDVAVVHGKHHQRHQYVNSRHEGHHEFREAGDRPQAAKNHQGRDRGDSDTDQQLVEAKGALHRISNRVGLNGVEHQAERKDQTNGKNAAGPWRFKSLCQIESRPPAILPFTVTDLVELGQGTFCVSGSHAHQCNHPHPENGSGSTEIESYRHASDIAGANP